MYSIAMDEMSEEFRPLWQAAGRHLNHQVEGGLRSWLRAHPHPPFLEHLSFRLGNQLFFLRVEDADGLVQGPGNPQGHVTAAAAANGHACVLPMRYDPAESSWRAVVPGWGLLDAHSGQTVNPAALVTDERIVMSDWEVQGMAVQFVRDHLRQKGHTLMSWQLSAEVDPSIWFVGASDGPEWVVVRAVRHPQRQAQRPANWAAIVEGCSQLASTGHFASVSMRSSAQQPGEDPLPLWRGHGLNVGFAGLQAAE